MTYQKIPLSRTLPAFVNMEIRDALDRLGKALPATVASVNGSIVTVNFSMQGVQLPQTEMPVAGSQYVRLPIQVGDAGVCFPADVDIGVASGLGNTQSPSLTRVPNLSALVFFPIGNLNWTAVTANILTLYGPDGVTIRDSGTNAEVQLTPSQITATIGGNALMILNSSSIQLSAGGHTFLINSSGIQLDGLVFTLHTHSGVTTGSGVTGPVVP